MLQFKVLVFEFLAIDTLAPGSIATGEVTSLTHETWNHAMEFAALVVKRFSTFAYPLFSRAQRAKVLCGLWNDIPKESYLDASGGLSTNFNIEVDGMGDVSCADVLSPLRNGGRR